MSASDEFVGIPRPRSSYLRFETERPNEIWQSDFTHYRLAGGQDVEILSWLDDRARYALSGSAHRRIPARSCSLPSTQPRRGWNAVLG